MPDYTRFDSLGTDVRRAVKVEKCIFAEDGAGLEGRYYQAATLLVGDNELHESAYEDVEMIMRGDVR